AGVAWLAAQGAPDERGFWPMLVAALFVGMVLAKDRGLWAEVTLDGMGRRMVMVMIVAWLLAGVLGALMAESGFVEALVWCAEAAGVRGPGYVVAAFLICCVVSTSTGTSLGTVILCAPLLYPPGGALGADPAFLMGAILGGATFGDNISPVSDTTIASSLSQDAEMRAVVRSRLRYALPAAATAMAVFAIFGGAEGVASTGGVAESSARGLPMLLAPAFVLFLLLRGRHLMVGLLSGIAAALAVGLGLGLLTPHDVLHINPDAFAARGLIVDGLNRGIGVSIFTVLLMGLVAGVESAGLVDRVVRFAEGRARSKPAAERWAVGTVSATAFLTTHGTVAILTAGELTRRLGARFGVGPERRANLLDITACSWPHIMPWFIPAILTASTTSSGESFGMPRLSPFEVGVTNAHSWALLLMALLAVFAGYGREKDPVPRDAGSSGPADEGRTP
ncbi:MAG: Na+/H+ antiporter NhaC family protein, partial [Acidobacteriota bacterium]